ncbi:MAG: hypothetical protein NTW03_17035, partial [Verrucomicrobia bacterium]|nr:hypothetical protein [Verrucomicrobiota bacterium]
MVGRRSWPESSNGLGKIITARTGFLHSSDLDPEKPLNWKRIVEYNGEYGCMGDLGLQYCGKDQVWGCIQNGYETPFPTITGLNFEFGFPDAFLQMWAAFIHELLQAKPLRKFAGCATPEEAAMSHRLFTAALKSQQCGPVEAIPPQQL